MADVSVDRFELTGDGTYTALLHDDRCIVIGKTQPAIRRFKAFLRLISDSLAFPLCGVTWFLLTALHRFLQ